jgi:hypothetical protein
VATHKSTATIYRETGDGEEIAIEVKYTYRTGCASFYCKSFGGWLPGDPPELEVEAKDPTGKLVELTEDEENSLCCMIEG